MSNKKDPARGTGFFAPAEGYRSVAHLLDRVASVADAKSFLLMATFELRNWFRVSPRN
jgi:hypothetical protein